MRHLLVRFPLRESIHEHDCPACVRMPYRAPTEGRVRPQWLRVCVSQRAVMNRGLGIRQRRLLLIANRHEAEQQRAGRTCGEVQLRFRVDGPCWFRGLRCGAITTGLERHGTALGSLPGRARGLIVPEPLRPPTKFPGGQRVYVCCGCCCGVP